MWGTLEALAMNYLFDLSQHKLGYSRELTVFFLNISLYFWKELNPKVSEVTAQIHTLTHFL